MGNPAWYLLHRSAVIPKGSSEAEEFAAARQYLGYVPTSPTSRDITTIPEWMRWSIAGMAHGVKRRCGPHWRPMHRCGRFSTKPGLFS